MWLGRVLTDAQNFSSTWVARDPLSSVGVCAVCSFDLVYSGTTNRNVNVRTREHERHRHVKYRSLQRQYSVMLTDVNRS